MLQNKNKVRRRMERANRGEEKTILLIPRPLPQTHTHTHTNTTTTTLRAFFLSFQSQKKASVEERGSDGNVISHNRFIYRC